jgi:PIN domain nuclease of toxin-antitoxin system
VRLLLDTHLLLWVVALPKHVPSKLFAQISSRQNAVFYSTISLAEIALKRRAGRRSEPEVPAGRIHELAKAAGLQVLQLTPEHAAAAEGLAVFHGDPFDRLLLAQAQAEGLQLITHDERLAQYDSRTILF